MMLQSRGLPPISLTRSAALAVGCLIAFLMAVAPGCNREGNIADSEDGGLRSLVGKIEIDGSSTVYPITVKVATAFREEFPGVDIPVGVHGTGGGFDRFTRGEIDISDASRPIKWSEFEQARANGISFVELPVAYDGLTIVVHPANDWVRQLTVDELKRIFVEGQQVETWKDINASWPDLPIKIFSPGTDSGTFDYFKETVVGKEGAMRSDVSPSEDDNQLVTGVKAERGAIAFFGASYYFNNRDSLRAVPIVNPDTGQPMMPTPANVESGVYAPFSRPLFIYVRETSLRRPEVKKFVQFYLENAAQLATEVDYVPLPRALYELAQKHYEERLTGTHFWQEGGEQIDGPLAEVYSEENLLSVEK